MSLTQDSAPVHASESCPQGDAAFCFEWGEHGLKRLAPTSDVVVIVDILGFTTSVSAAVEAGATVVAARSDEHNVVPLSPTDLLCLDPGQRVVLVSPNGGMLACLARELGVRQVLAGSLRNASATAALAAELAGQTGTITLIGAGDRWGASDAMLRPAVEDLIGAGAVLAALDPAAAASGRRCSTEAGAARAAFVAARPRLYEALAQSTSGRELDACGKGDDVAMASALDVTRWAAVLDDDAFVARSPLRHSS